MNFDQDYTDLRSIHILLLRIENLPIPRLNFYKDLLSRSNKVHLSSLNFSRENLDMLTSLMTLTGDEDLEFKFITSELPQYLFPLQTHKTIFAVYGVGESVNNIMQAYKTLEDYVKKFQFSVIWKLFCFEPRMEDNVYEITAPNLILFHPNTGMDKLVMNVGIVMNDLAYWIMVGIMNLLKEYSGKEFIATPEENEPSKVKKKKQGRYTKMHGDVCLLFGNFLEANKKYEESLDKYKSQIDWVWMAAIQENMACIACYRANYDLASNKFTEAENNYLKARNGKMNIECQFRFARFMVKCGKKVKAVKKLARLLDSNIDGIDQSDRLLVSKSLAQLCKEIGFERKAGFFYRLAASSCLDQNLSEAHELLKTSAEAYLITEEKQTSTEKGKNFDRNLFMIRENLKPWMRGDYSGWRNLQKVTLEHLKAIAKKIGDIDSSVKYTWNLLLNSVMEPDFQDQLRVEIEQDSLHLSSINNFRSPVQLIGLTPVENKLEVAIHNPDDFFLHNPWLQKKLNWIKDSIHSVKVVVQHKLSFNLHVELTKLIVEGEAECIPTEKNLASKVKENIEYLIVPKSHGKLVIKGLQFQTMGLMSFIYINPIEIEIMQSLPELEFKLVLDDDKQEPVNEVVMLTSEQLEIFLSIKNISGEALGKFSIECNPDIAALNQDDMTFLQTLPRNSEYLMPITLSAYEKDTVVKFSINYSNSEGIISLNTKLELQMKVKEGIEIEEASIEPHFKFPWHKQLRDINPSMSEKCYAFFKRHEDLGINDSLFCKVKFLLFNKCKDKLLIKGTVKDSNKFKEVTLEPQKSSLIELKINRVPNPTEKYLNDVISLQWTCIANNRRGDLANFSFKPDEMIFVKESRVGFSVKLEKEGSFYCATAGINCSESLKGMNLYFYPFKVMDNIKLNPHELMLSGCLALAIGEVSEYKLKYLPTGPGDFRLVLGVGNKNRVYYWSFRDWKLNS